MQTNFRQGYQAQQTSSSCPIAGCCHLVNLMAWW